MRNVAIFGAGRIGRAIHSTLIGEGIVPAMFDISDYDNTVFDAFDVFVCATPWHATLKIAQEVAKREGKIYLDMTEDVEVGRIIRAGSKSVMIPHCGLAPGAVSIIAGSMLPCSDLYIAVGALPVHPTGELGYSLTWSPEGLVNEYCNPCPALLGGKKVSLIPLNDVHTFDGYEYFNTSGGLGTLLDTLELEKMDAVQYQTIRYIGHAYLMRFMRDDLKFATDQYGWVTLLNRSLPSGGEDKVLIKIYGDQHGRYIKDIRGADGLSAIQRTTAAGLSSVLLWATSQPYSTLQSKCRPGNWIANEDIPLVEVQKFRCWSDIYNG